MKSLLYRSFQTINLKKFKIEYPILYDQLLYKLVIAKIKKFKENEEKKIIIQNELLNEFLITQPRFIYNRFKKILIKKRRLLLRNIFLDNKLPYDINSYVIAQYASQYIFRDDETNNYRYKKYIIEEFYSGKDPNADILFTPRNYPDFHLIIRFCNDKTIAKILKKYLHQTSFDDELSLSDYPPKFSKYLTNGIKLLLKCNIIPIQINNIYRIKDKEIRDIVLTNPKMYPQVSKIKIFYNNYIQYIKKPILLGICTGILLHLLTK